MLRGVILLSLCATSTLAFSLSPLAFAPAPLAFSPRFPKRASPASAQRCGGLRMQTEPEETQGYAEQGPAEGVEKTPVSREPSSWFEKTTAQVRPALLRGNPPDCLGFCAGAS